jgi:hypothetical protein
VKKESSSGHRRIGPADGIFPAGCKWRDVQEGTSNKDFWAVEQYQYWDEARQKWTDKQPEACLMKGIKGKHG